jgi:hypothetical protein
MTQKVNTQKQPNYRWGVASRSLSATLGGYALAASMTACLTLVLPMSRQNAVPAAAMLGYVGFTAAVIWSFSCSSAWKAWGGVLIPTACCLLVVWLKTGGLIK